MICFDDLVLQANNVDLLSLYHLIPTTYSFPFSAHRREFKDRSDDDGEY